MTERPRECRCLAISQDALQGDAAQRYVTEHLRASGLHWEDQSHSRSGYSCHWTGRYWLLEQEGGHRLSAVSGDEWRAAASVADNDFAYAVDQVFDLKERGVGVSGSVEWGSVLNGQTLEVLDQSGAVVTRVTAVVGFHGGLLLTGPGRHLVRGGYRLRHRIGDG